MKRAATAWRISAMSGTANTVAALYGDLAGNSAGSTNRVTASATASPTMVKSPSWAKPVKLENNIAPKPHTDVSIPSRIVGQIRVSVAEGSLPGAVWVNR